MATYFPIKMKIEIKASRSAMAALYWRLGSVVADFDIPDDRFSSLRVRFDRAYIVRALDEMPLSTEEEVGESKEGFVTDHLAYRVEGSFFWRSQSETFKMTHNDARHYRFITGDACLDVVAPSAPLISVVPIDSGPGQISN